MLRDLSMQGKVLFEMLSVVYQSLQGLSIGHLGVVTPNCRPSTTQLG